MIHSKVILVALRVGPLRLYNSKCCQPHVGENFLSWYQAKAVRKMQFLLGKCLIFGCGLPQYE